MARPAHHPGKFNPTLSRRESLRAGFGALGLLMTGSTLYGCGSSGSASARSLRSNIGNLGPLGDADANGVRLPAGFSSRIIATAREAPVEGSEYLWHLMPDGGATFATDDGGWIYVSNSEIPARGGVGALRFDVDGQLVDAYPILQNTMINCAGGPTPWGTWLSCEEFAGGRVWECDPYGVDIEGANLGRVHPALGVFQHEAVAVDPETMVLYLTEDVSDGGFYRFVPATISEDGVPSLDDGVLEIAEVADDGSGRVTWHALLDPQANPFSDPDAVATRYQIPESSPFRGGEGVWWHDGIVYFSTKGDNRIWAHDTGAQTIEVLYDDDTSENPILTGVDNILVSPAGDVMVAEDGGDMQIVAITPEGVIAPVIQIVGQDDSEITGPAFSPDLTRLYFSSQRGGPRPIGLTYEVTGPFFS